MKMIFFLLVTLWLVLPFDHAQLTHPEHKIEAIYLDNEKVDLKKGIPLEKLAQGEYEVMRLQMKKEITSLISQKNLQIILTAAMGSRAYLSIKLTGAKISLPETKVQLKDLIKLAKTTFSDPENASLSKRIVIEVTSGEDNRSQLIVIPFY